MAKTYKIHGLPDLPEGYGPELEYGVPTKESVILNTLPGNRSGWSRPATFGYGLYAQKEKPWYPAEWYDEHGHLLPDVYEHTPGEWPQYCKPGDTVSRLYAEERAGKEFLADPRLAEDVSWSSPDLVVAYRVIERGDR
ncbi:MAG: hypothetical protein ACK5XE_00670 [Burkholderiales bacterium]|jgi:hypothetical protein